MKYDIAIIGGGPAGYTAAERAAAGGLKTVIFEKKAMGGVCLNEGCIPTKTLLYSAKLLDNAKGAAKYGIAVPDGISFNLEKIIDRKDKVVKKLTGGVKQTVKSYGAELIEKEAVITGEDNGLIQILAGGEKYEVTYLLVCTGSDTVIPPIKGLSEIDYWTSKEALEMAALPKSLAIIGGGVIGMEFASFFNSMGVKVSVIEMMPEILGAMDKETSAMLRTEYQKRGINFQLNSKVIEVSPAGVTIEKAGKLSLIEADKVLVSVGRKANLNQVGLDKLKVEMVRNGVKVDEHMLTSHPKVYACGDITGYSMLAHTAIRESEVAINHILGVEDRMNYHCVPGVVYTNPELAGVGKTEEELKASGTSYHVQKLPMAYSGRFVAENETGNGLCKLILDEEDRIIGCHLLGNPASEIIVVAGIAVQYGYTVEEFQKNGISTSYGRRDLSRNTFCIMFCIDNRCTDVYFNLAVEEYLLKQTQGDYFVIWQSEPSVVMGKNQSVRAEVNEDYRIEKGIRLARRFSGGGAVYHDKGNINLTFIETTSQPLFEDYLQRIVGFLETMGVTAYTDERLGIYLDGKKISGSAQCIHKNRVMYHCTLLFSANLDVLHTVLKGKSDELESIPGLKNIRAVPSVPSEVVNLNCFLDVSVNIKRFIHLLFHYFLIEDEQNSIYHFSRKDLAAIELLKVEKYANEDWIHHRGTLKKI